MEAALEPHLCQILLMSTSLERESQSCFLFGLGSSHGNVMADCAHFLPFCDHELAFRHHPLDGLTRLQRPSLEYWNAKQATKSCFGCRKHSAASRTVELALKIGDGGRRTDASEDSCKSETLHQRAA